MAATRGMNSFAIGSPALKRVRAGQPFRPSAAAHNAMVNLATAAGLGGGALGIETPPAWLRSGYVVVQNRSGTPREQFDVLGIDGVLIEPSANEFAFREGPRLIGGLPTPDHAGKFVILQSPVVYDSGNRAGLAMAAASGLTVCRVRMNEPDHLYADVADGECGFLDSAAVGSAELLWSETVDPGDTAWAVARIGLSPPHAYPIIITNVAGSDWPYLYSAKLWRGGTEGIGPELPAHNKAEAFYPTGNPDTWEDSFAPLDVGEVVAAAVWNAATEQFEFDVTRIVDADEC